MTGFNSKRAMTRIDDINVERPVRRRPWPAMLHGLWLRHARLGRATNAIEIAFSRMQAQWPGPYTLEEVYDDSIQSHTYRLKFEDPRKEMLWKIENSA